MSEDETRLTERDYYLLGMLAERQAQRGWLPRGCTDEQAELLVRAGYLERVAVSGLPGPYAVTAKGAAAWQAYRFRGSLA